jgi:hypothetical protein
VTREFLKQLAKARPAQATIVRTYASVRHFARWIHEKVAPYTGTIACVHSDCGSVAFTAPKTLLSRGSCKRVPRSHGWKRRPV